MTKLRVAFRNFAKSAFQSVNYLPKYTRQFFFRNGAAVCIEWDISMLSEVLFRCGPALMAQRTLDMSTFVRWSNRNNQTASSNIKSWFCPRWSNLHTTWFLKGHSERSFQFGNTTVRISSRDVTLLSLLPKRHRLSCNEPQTCLPFTLSTFVAELLAHSFSIDESQQHTRDAWILSAVKMSFSFCKAISDINGKFDIISAVHPVLSERWMCLHHLRALMSYQTAPTRFGFYIKSSSGNIICVHFHVIFPYHVDASLSCLMFWSLLEFTFTNTTDNSTIQYCCYRYYWQQYYTVLLLPILLITVLYSTTVTDTIDNSIIQYYC
jgi:hypothetical protein